MTDIFTLGIKADTTDIDRGSDRLDDFSDSATGAEKKTGQLRDGVNTAGKAVLAFGAVAATAMGAVATAAGESAREIENLARLSNLNTDEFQKAAFAAKAYGIEQDKLADIFKDTQDKVGDFLKTGGGPMLDFFEQVAPKVGVTADEFKNLSGKDALQLYTTSLEKANLSQSEMVFFMEAIASDSTLLQPLLANNGAEFERMGNRAEELGIILNEMDIDNLVDMNMAMSELGATSAATSQVIGATLAPFITDLVNKFNEASIEGDTLREGMTDIIEVGVRVAGVFADAGRVFEIFGKAIGATAFTVVESFNTMDLRLAQFAIGFGLTFNELQLKLTQWINEQDEELARWATNMINATDVFDLFDDVTIKPQPIDTSELEASIDVMRTAFTLISDDLVTSNENIANAWQDVRDLMMEELPSSQFTNWFTEIDKTIGKQRELQKEIKKTGKGNEKITGTAVNDAKKWVSGTKDITKELGTAFGKNEKVAKKLHQVNQAIAIAEQAMILQKVFTDSAATQTHIANSTAKATANATEAVTAAAAAPFPTGFAAAAAMIGLMASVLGGSGGGGGGAPSQIPLPDSSVLGGGDPSESLVSSQDRLEEIQIEQLAELRGIKGALNETSAQATSLANSIFRDDALNTFRPLDATGQEALRAQIGTTGGSGFGIDLSNVIESEVSASFRQIQSSVVASVGEAAEALGLSMGEATMGVLRFSTKQAGEILRGELEGEDLVAAINEVISTGSDKFVEMALPNLLEFQKIGEGAFETLIRVTQEQSIFNSALSKMGGDLSSLSTIMQVDVAQSIFDLIGGVERFNDLTGEFFSEFFTEAEQFEHLSTSLTGAVEGLGLSMFDSRDDFRAMVEGLDLTTEAGQSLFASLLELVPAMDEYFDVLENDSAEAATDAERALEKARRAEEDAAKSLTSALGSLVREMEQAAKASFKGLIASVKAQQGELKSQLAIEISGIQANFDARRVEVESKTASRVASLNNQISRMGNTVSELSGLSDSIGSALGSLANVDRAGAFSNVEAAIARAQAGGSLTGLNLEPSISALGDISTESFGSALDEQRERARTSSVLGELNDLTGNQLSAAERTVEMLERQITTVEAIGERELEKLDELQLEAEAAAEDRFQVEFDQLQSIIDTAQEELNAVLGIETGVLSIVDAQAVFNDRLADLAAAVQVQADDIAKTNADAKTEARVEAERLQAEQRETNENLQAALKVIAITSAKSAKVLSNWDNDGQPEERIV